MKKLLSVLALGLFSVACAEVDSEPTNTYVFPAELAEAGVLAVESWTAATGGVFTARIVISDDECTPSADVVCVVALDRVPRCGNDHQPWACYRPNRIQVSRAYATSEIRHSLIAHEIGHHLGLGHEDGSIMAKGRDMATRHYGCISAETAALVAGVEPHEASEACAFDPAVPWRW